MTLLNKTTVYLKIVLISLILINITACSDDDDPIAPEEHHFEAIGTVIYNATGAIDVSILRGTTTDTLYAVVGERSDHFEVKFYDENENIIEPPDEEHSSMAYEIEDSQIATGWQHEGEEGEFEFHIDGLKTGITTIEIFVKHDDHNDYRSGLIPLKVVSK
ncbi:MAG: hypothetical protein JEY94_05170 [Melioribacteraceae bacterium]|nr:hypothetical protein [Melioribacteraceae bacterium]